MIKASELRGVDRTARKKPWSGTSHSTERRGLSGTAQTSGLAGTVSGQNPSQLQHVSGETGTRGTAGTSSTFPPAHLLSQGRQHQLPCTLPKQPTLSPYIQHIQTVPEWQTPEAVPLKSILKAEARKSRAAVLGRPAPSAAGKACKDPCYASGQTNPSTHNIKTRTCHHHGLFIHSPRAVRK